MHSPSDWAARERRGGERRGDKKERETGEGEEIKKDGGDRTCEAVPGRKGTIEHYREQKGEGIKP